MAVRYDEVTSTHLDELAVGCLLVDASPRLLRGPRLLDVHVEAIDRVATLVHRWFP